MRVLLDESVPRALATLLEDHEVRDVKGMGWRGIANGQLLHQALGAFDVLVTADRGFEHEQNLEGIALAVVLLTAPRNRMQDYLPFEREIRRAVAEARPGTVVKVGR